MNVVQLPVIELEPEVGSIVLALADDEFVIGHRHSEWLGLSPFLEEDLAMASIAQDELGHARALYGVLWPSWTARDAMLPLRVAADWRSCAFVEFAAQPWERHLVRHVLYDVIERHRWQALLTADHGPLRSLADRALVEERWHERHALDLLQRLGATNTARLQPHVDDLLPMVSALTDGLSEGEAAVATADLQQILSDAGLTPTQIDMDPAPPSRGTRSAGFADVHTSITEVASIDPAASW